MNYILKYEKIVENFIKKDFPSLKDQKIIIKEKKAKYRAHVMYFPWGMTIYFNQTLRKFPEKIIKRIIFHELCHLELFKEKGWIKPTNTYTVFHGLKSALHGKSRLRHCKKVKQCSESYRRRKNVRKPL